MRRKLREGTITIFDLPATLRRNYPGYFYNPQNPWKLDEIKAACTFAYLSEVALEFAARSGPEELLALWAEWRADADIARALVFGAASAGLEDEAVGDFLHERLEDDRPLVVAEAIDGIALRGADVDPCRIDAWASDPAPEIRSAAMRFLATNRGLDAQERLVAALDDPAYLVRENAIDELRDLEVQTALPVLRTRLADAHPYVRQAAERAIATLGNSAASPGYLHGLAEDGEAIPERTAPGDWLEHWDKNPTPLRMDKADQILELGTLTIYCQRLPA